LFNVLALARKPSPDSEGNVFLASEDVERTP